MNLKTLPANTAGRDFVVGDLHGSFSLLEKALSQLNFDTAKDRLISVGDLVDRGPDSLECLYLLTWPWFHSVYSNHENMMEEFFNGGIYGGYWKMNGGGWFDHLPPEQQKVVTDELLPIVSDLPYVITIDQANGKKFHVVHAEFYSHVSDEILADPKSQGFLRLLTNQANDGQAIIWGRGLFRPLAMTIPDNRDLQKYVRGAEMHKTLDIFDKDLSPIYSGHTVMTQPTRIGKQTNLDTGAVFSYRKDSKEWLGLTITEPATDRFWFCNQTSFKEVQPLVVM